MKMIIRLSAYRLSTGSDQVKLPKEGNLKFSCGGQNFAQLH